jgi:hypothetical protein
MTDFRMAAFTRMFETNYALSSENEALKIQAKEDFRTIECLQMDIGCLECAMERLQPKKVMKAMHKPNPAMKAMQSKKTMKAMQSKKTAMKAMKPMLAPNKAAKTMKAMSPKAMKAMKA